MVPRELLTDTPQTRASYEWLDQRIEAAVERTLADLEMDAERTVSSSQVVSALSQQRHNVAY